jgi:hypothetical protein
VSSLDPGQGASPQSLVDKRAGHCRREFRELVSGIDALYLSGKVPLRSEDISELARFREDAIESHEPVLVMLGGEEFGLRPGSLNRYRFRLSHQNGEIGITTSEHLPQLRIQPRAHFLHAIGPAAAVEWFTAKCEAAFGPVVWSVSRLDLFADVQGWSFEGNDRDRFKCRARSTTLREIAGDFSGFNLGMRDTGTVMARIYDKTAEIKAKGGDQWFDIWGPRLDRDQPVIRIEFEVGRQGLAEFEITTVEEALSRAGGLWAALTQEWLTYRDRTSDATQSRWPVSDFWLFVQRAELRGNAIGLHRTRARRGAGEIRLLIPAFVGYLAGIARHFDVDTLDEALGVARAVVHEDEARRDVLFEHRLEIVRNQARFG